MAWLFKAFDDGMLKNNHEEEIDWNFHAYILSRTLAHRKPFNNSFHHNLSRNLPSTYTVIEYYLRDIFYRKVFARALI